MPRKGRKLRKFEWEKILGRKAWTAQELAPRLGLAPICMRRYLRIYTVLGRLERKRFGVLWYYAVKRFFSPPDLSYPCPICKGKMDIYKVRCGCEFQICSMDFVHSRFTYCGRHKIEKETVQRTGESRRP